MKLQKDTFLKAADWLNGKKREFNTGITILKEAAFKPAVVMKLERDGAQGPAAQQRLEHQMREFVKAFGITDNVPDTDAELHVFDGQEAPADQDEQQQLGIMAVAGQMESGEISIDNEHARTVIQTYAEAYRRREKAMRLMAEVGETNDEQSMEQRKIHSTTIDACTTLMEALYPLFEKYQSGADISQEELAEAMDNGTPAGNQPASTAADSEAECPAVPPAEPSAALAGKSRDELLKLKKNAQVRLLRTENKLLYQSEKKLEAENPMPEGPERVKLETRAANIRKEIEDIDMAIAKFG